MSSGSDLITGAPKQLCHSSNSQFLLRHGISLSIFWCMQFFCLIVAQEQSIPLSHILLRPYW
ncbi:hypothetical protein SAY87_023424 [Trapa incisa]|uniref:Uncharacterized protein n=1 Tax=Trapa incisa TaxID=236973 RepID=A0AAN7L3F3_9MYRT|nr:hypothetical protein SAY87_023424 [Trapa incisa]